MIELSNDDILINHQAYVKAYENSACASFLQDGFMEKSFPILEKEYRRQYPYQVKIPKDLPDLLKGDFEPKTVITIEEPIQSLYSNIWFGDSTNGVYLRGGYVNGDSRYICKQKLDDANIHMVLGGSTGQGKSVTLNAFIFGICCEYAPWEVCLTMCDAKIVEFKSYALQTPMPHIRSIAATGDADYLISVLDDVLKEMNLYNAVYPLAGVKNIKDFRKKTGLCLPQNIIVIDEFQTMFKMAGKKRSVLDGIIDGFARLGRSTGYHLLLASQELGSDIGKGTLANIKVRAAMGCTADISTKILGNDEAKNNFGKKGRLLFNLNSEGGNKADNQMVQVPYMPDDQRVAIGEDIIRTSKNYDYKRVMSFYDEDAKVYESEYDKYLDKFTLNKNTIALGEPSFILNDPEQVVKIHMTGDDIENICVLSNSNIAAKRYFSMLKKNIMRHKGIQNIVLCADTVFANECKPQELAAPALYRDERNFQTSFIISVAKSIVYKRRLAIEIDKKVFDNVPYTDSTDEDFYKVFKKGSVFDTDLNRRRFYFAVNSMVTDPECRTNFGLENTFGGSPKITDKEIAEARKVVELYETYNALGSKLTYRELPMVYCWLLGVTKLNGLGRDSKTQNVNAMKKLFMDCSEVNVRFIWFASTMEDVTELAKGTRWFILDGAPSNDLNKIKAADEYPAQVSSVLAVLFDTQAKVGEKCLKFKKMIFDGEIVI